MAIYKLSAEPLSLSAAPIPMDSPSPSPSSPSPSPLIHPHPLAAAASFLRHHVSRLGSELSARVDQGRRFVLSAAAPRVSLPPFAAASVGSAAAASASQGKHAFDLALSADYVAKTLAGTAVYTVSNSNNEFVLISDPNNSFRSLGILCFRQEDAHTLLAQVPFLSLRPRFLRSLMPHDLLLFCMLFRCAHRLKSRNFSPLFCVSPRFTG